MYTSILVQPDVLVYYFINQWDMSQMFAFGVFFVYGTTINLKYDQWCDGYPNNVGKAVKWLILVHNYSPCHSSTPTPSLYWLSVPSPLWHDSKKLMFKFTYPRHTWNSLYWFPVFSPLSRGSGKLIFISPTHTKQSFPFSSGGKNLSMYSSAFTPVISWSVTNFTFFEDSVQLSPPDCKTRGTSVDSPNPS